MSTLRKRSAWVPLGGMAIALVAAAALMGLNSKPATAADNTQSLSVVQALSNTFEQVATKSSPAVVNIRVEKDVKGNPALFNGQGGMPMDPQGMLERFFGQQMGGQEMQEHAAPDQGTVPVGEGSGFIVSEDGFIVTNHHVAGDADHLKVTLEDGRSFDAKLVGSDPQTEIALIKVDAHGLPTVKFSDSDSLRVGEWVMAIGSPFGLRHSVTSGIVSARGRGNVGIVDYADFIQTDASINPGNSGGPLLDMNGDVVGMNTAIMSRTGGSNGIGFAIPANMVKYIVDQLRDHGAITRGFLGVSIQELTPELAKWFGVNEGHGVLIADVSKDSPAEKAGLQRDDVIVAFDGQPVGEIGAFRSHVSTTTPGKKFGLTILRKGERVEKTVDVGSLPTEKMASANTPGQPEHSKLGVAVQGLTDDLARRMGYEGENGVIVAQVAPGSEAARAGVKPGMLIREVNRQPVNNPREFQEAVKKDSREHTALLLVQEGQSSRYVALDVA